MCAADYFVYYPENTSRIMMGSMSYIGLFLGTFYSEILGVGLASGAPSKPEWSSAFTIGPGSLMVEAYAPLGGFGKLCAVILALGPSIIPFVVMIAGNALTKLSLQHDPGHLLLRPIMSAALAQVFENPARSVDCFRDPNLHGLRDCWAQ
jgi:hypothetical protein